jgi:hypothetical protein
MEHGNRVLASPLASGAEVASDGCDADGDGTGFSYSHRLAIVVWIVAMLVWGGALPGCSREEGSMDLPSTGDHERHAPEAAGTEPPAPPPARVEAIQPPVAVAPIPPPPPPPPPAPAPGIHTVDEILDSMAEGNLAFNTPPSLVVDERTDVELLLSLEESIDALRERIEAAGTVEGARVRLAPRMQARLTGRGFAITAISDELQAVAAREPTRWRWEIEAKDSGDQSLHLTLSALLDVAGRETPRTLRTFDRAIHVRVTTGQRITRFVGGNWQWLWSVVLIPVAGWALARWRSRRRSTS